MLCYHCSPTHGIQTLQPRTPLFSDKPQRVYLTTLLPMALLYGIQNFEYTYGYTREKQIYYEEYFPNSLEYLYSGKSASLYLCEVSDGEPTRIPNEIVVSHEVPVVQEIVIPDVYQALLEQESLGALPIYRYDALSPERRAANRKMEIRVILEAKLLEEDSPYAVYMQTHYPESWEEAKLQWGK